MTYWLCDECAHWLPLTICPDESADAPQTVYVDADDAPTSGGGVYRVLGYCYQFDPNATPVCLPQDAITTTLGGTSYTDCTECINDTGGDSGGSGAPGSAPGTGGGSGGGGGVTPPGSGGDPPQPCYIQASLCTGHSGGPDVYVHCDGIPSGTTIFRYGGRCYSVNSSEPSVTDPPADAHVVWVSGSYQSCSECTDGVQAQLCPTNNPPDTSEAPDLWTPVNELPAQPVYFNIEGFCYSLDPNDAPAVIPPTAKIMVPSGQYTGCDACLTGVQATLCADQPNTDQAPDVWVETDELPDGPRVWQIRGWCYHLDPSDTPQRIPEGATVVTAVDQFIDCAACLCGEPKDDNDESCGIKAKLCPDQGDVQAEDLWIKCDDLPANPIVFERAGLCYHLDPAWGQGKIPKGAVTISPSSQHKSCWDCVSRIFPPPGGGGGGGWDPPPWPCPFPPCPPVEWYYQLAECPDANPVDKWIRQDHICGVFNIVPCDVRGLVFLLADGKCYQVTENGKTEPPGAVVNNQVVFGPFPLSGGNPCGYKLTDCDGAKAPKYTFENLTDYEGKVVKLEGEGDTCWLVEVDSPCAEMRDDQIQLTQDTPQGGFNDCVDCQAEFSQEWTFTDSGFIDGGQDGASRSYDDPSTVAASPWSISNEGRSVRIDWEDDDNCQNHNPYTQSGTATATITVPQDTIMTVSWSGKGETQDPGFELMDLSVDGDLLGEAHAPGGGQGCSAMGDVISDPAPPQEKLLTAGTHTLTINATTNDPLYHFGAWYQFDLSFRADDGAP